MTTKTAPVDLIACLPPLLLDWAEEPSNPVLSPHPTQRDGWASVMAADLVGFTRLTSQLTRQGPAGAEEMQRLLNLCFGRITEHIYAHGGQVLRFAGDAALAFWRVDREADLHQAAMASARCAFDALEAVNTLDAPGVERLVVRVGLGVGSVTEATVGGANDRWELLVGGEAVDQMSASLAAARPSEVVASSSMWSLLSTRRSESSVSARFLASSPTQTPGSDPGSKVLRLEQATSSRDRVSDHQDGFLVGQDQRPSERQPPEAHRSAALGCFVPSIVRSRVTAGKTHWLAEFRRASVLFLGLGPTRTASDAGPERDLLKGDFDLLQEAINAVQTTVYRYGGSLNQLVIDDKGLVMVAAWGTALSVHEDDAQRAVLAGLQIADQLEQLDLNHGIGIGTGRVFSGWRGNWQRTEFALIGSVVNLAARLMQEALAGTVNTQLSVLCGAATVTASHPRIAFEHHDPISLKGYPEPIAIAAPINDSGQLSSVPTAIDQQPLIGRTRELRTFDRHLAEFATSGKGHTLFLEAEAGIGKSRLAQELVARTKAAGLAAWTGTADAIEATPMRPWRSVIASAFGIAPSSGGAPDPAVVEEVVLQALRALRNDQRKETPQATHEILRRTSAEDLAPLLSPAFGLDLEETKSTRALTPQVRAERSTDLLSEMISSRVREVPAVVFLEDGQWFDSPSWRLVEAVARTQRLLMVVSTRPLHGEGIDEYSRLLRPVEGGDSKIANLLSLAPLEDEEIQQLAAQRLGVERMPGPARALIASKAEGNPLFAEQFALALRDTGLLRVSGPECTLEVSPEELHKVSFPDRVQGIVAARIDQLSAHQQQMLKVASVLGREFQVADLAYLLALSGEDFDLQQEVEQMARLDLLGPRNSDSEDDGELAFHHSVTQQVAYDLLPFAQRHNLNRETAQHLERLDAEANGALVDPARLAHHWREAQDPRRTLHHLVRAMEQARTNDANEEVVRHLTEMLRLEQELPIEDTPPLPELEPQDWHPEITAEIYRRARWKRILGRTLERLCRYAESAAELEAALALLGKPFPKTRLQQLRWLLGGATTQAWHRLWPQAAASRKPPRSTSETSVHGPKESQLRLEAMRCLGALSTVGYHQVSMPIMLLPTVYGLNLAEGMAPTEDLVHVYARAAMAGGIVRAHRLSETYSKLALETDRSLAAAGQEPSDDYLAAIYLISRGDWSAVALVEEAVDRAQRYGSRRRWEGAMMVLALANNTCGKFDVADQLARELLLEGKLRGAPLTRAWGHRARAEALLCMGELDQSEFHSRAALALFSENQRALATIATQSYSLLASSLLRQGRRAEAWKAAETALQRSLAAQVIGYDYYSWFSGPCEVFLDLWNQGFELNGESPTELAQLACHHFAKTDRKKPPPYARALLSTGLAQWLQGRHRRARRNWRKCLEQCDRFSMDYQEAFSRYSIAKVTGPTGPDYRANLDRAIDLFGQLGVDRQRAAAEAYRDSGTEHPSDPVNH